MISHDEFYNLEYFAVLDYFHRCKIHNSDITNHENKIELLLEEFVAEEPDFAAP